MPDFPATPAPYAKGSYSLSMLDTQGQIGRASLNGPSVLEADPADLEAWRAAVGNASNAAIYASNLNTEESVNPGIVVPLDEAVSSVTNKLILIFQNNEQRVRRLEIPAPDASLFGPDGKTPVVTSGIGLALVNTTLVILNAGDPAGTYAYIKGGLGDRSRSGGIARNKPTISEPGVGVLPPAAPGL